MCDDRHFSRLIQQQQCYVDYTGAALHSEVHVRQFMEDCLTGNNCALLGNPHSQSSASRASSLRVAAARECVLTFFNVSSREYAVVFTSGATAALKLVAECFFAVNKDTENLTGKNRLWLTRDNHTSVLGMREIARATGSQVWTAETVSQLLGSLEKVPNFDSGTGRCLVALPAESNFHGKKASLAELQRLIAAATASRAQGDNGSTRQTYICLDAAALVANTSLDLARFSADFVVLSFYKMFGFPTGLGALLVRRDSAAQLLVQGKRYFGGGTVEAVTATESFHALRPDVSMCLEDGTVDFLGIAAIPYGFAFLDELGGVDVVGRKSFELARMFYEHLRVLKHPNGASVARIYGNWRSDVADDELAGQQGPVVTFSILRPDGSFVGHYEVDQLASLNKISLRSGCFCNAGACADSLQVDDSILKQRYESGAHVCWDSNDLVDGRPTGAVRVSFGAANNAVDVDTVITFVRVHFIRENVSDARDTEQPDSVVDSLMIYPVKSCGAFVLDTPGQSWPLSATGLLYDRLWAVVQEISRSNGEVIVTDVNQKKHSRMCLITPVVDRETRVVTLSSPFCVEQLHLAADRSIDGVFAHQSIPEDVLRVRVCGDSTSGECYAKPVDEWFSQAVGAPVRLIVRHSNLESRRGRGSIASDTACDISFSNQAQFLIVTTESVMQLKREIGDAPCHNITPAAFRPNIVVRTAAPGDLHGQHAAFREDAWKSILVGTQRFAVTGLCNRCRMVCIDQTTGKETAEPLRTLARVRRSRSSAKIFFGTLARHDPTSIYPHELRVGDAVRVLEISSASTDC